MVSFWGQKNLGPRPDRSSLGVNSKFPTSIPTPFICGVPAPPRHVWSLSKPRTTTYGLHFFFIFSPQSNKMIFPTN